MGYLIDSHCHLHDREFFTEEQAEEMLKRAREKNVLRIVCIGTSPEDSLAAAEFASTRPGVYWTYGVHPENALLTGPAARGPLGYDFFRDGVPRTRRYGARTPHSSVVTSGSPQKVCSEWPDTNFRPIAIGEVGLDYHYEGYDRDAQIRLFEEMLQLAVDNDLPVSFHIREAFSDFFPVVANFPSVRGVVHSFSDNKRNLRQILETTDFYVGVNGMATYSTLPTPPLSRILLETDAPFLTPVPFRGIINEPGHICDIAQWLSAKLGLEYQIIEEETTKNAEQLYRFPDTVVYPKR